jgi:hypothetical protein
LLATSVYKLNLNKTLFLICLSLILGGCSPALNWRKLAEAQFQLEMPCKPVKAARMLKLAGEERNFQLAACDAKGIKFSYSYAELGDEAKAKLATDEMEQSLRQHLGAAADASSVGVKLKSAQHARRLNLKGKAPNSKPVWVETLFFVTGKTAVQLTVLSEQGAIPVEVPDDFFRSVVLP